MCIRDSNNNNNNAKLRGRYVYDDKDGGVDDVIQKSRRTFVEHASPSSVRHCSSSTTNPSINRPDQSTLASPASQTSSTTSTNGPARDARQHSDDDASSSLVQLPWPAWVYCTRYSDRPSSGRHSKSSTPYTV